MKRDIENHLVSWYYEIPDMGKNVEQGWAGGGGGGGEITLVPVG